MIASTSLKSAVTCLLAASTLVVTACEDAPGAGSLQVFWVPGGMSCADAKITDVRVRVLDGTADVVPAVTAGCPVGQSDAGQVVPGVPAGTWSVRVEGLDSDGNANFAGQADAVTVRGGEQTAPPSIVLYVKRSTLRVTWGFAGGGLCGGNGVAKVDLSVINKDPQLVYPTDGASGLFPCDPPLTADNPNGGVLIPSLSPNQELTVHLFGLDTQNKRTWVGSTPTTTAAGKTTDVVVQLQACTGAACQ